MFIGMKGFAQRVLVVTLVIGAIALIAYVMQWILLILAGILLAILFRNIAQWIVGRTGWSQHAATTLVLVAIGLLIILGTWEFGSKISHQADQLLSKVSDGLQYWQHRAQHYETIRRLFSGSSTDFGSARTILKDAIHFAAAVVLVLFVGAYVSVDPDTYLDGLVRFFPGRRQRHVRDILLGIGAALKWWMLGQLIAMAAVGLITLIGLLIVGVPMAISLAVLSSLLTFVPYVGAIVSMIPALLIGFSVSAKAALYVAIVYLIAHVVEGYALGPIIQHRSSCHLRSFWRISF